MIVILLLIPLSIIIAVGFFIAFIWAVRSGQYEDTCTPAMRLLMEEKRQTDAKEVSTTVNPHRHDAGIKPGLIPGDGATNG